jgi:hypothetical protein
MGHRRSFFVGFVALVATVGFALPADAGGSKLTRVSGTATAVSHSEFVVDGSCPIAGGQESHQTWDITIRQGSANETLTLNVCWSNEGGLDGNPVDTGTFKLVTRRGKITGDITAGAIWWRWTELYAFGLHATHGTHEFKHVSGEIDFHGCSNKYTEEVVAASLDLPDPSWTEAPICDQPPAGA